jgi:phage tail-like protein
MAPVHRDDPYPGYAFRVLITGVSDDGTVPSGSFSEASGLEVDIPPIEYRNGSEPATPRKMRGIIKYNNIVLKRGETGDIQFWNWVVEAINGNPRRTEGSVILLDEARNEVMRWNFQRGWPAKYTGPGLNAANNEIAMETLEIAHEGLKIDGQTG